MKKLLFFTSLFVSCGTLNAATRFSISTGTVPREPQDYTSDAVYYSTQTCSNSNLGNVIISTVGASIYIVSISSKGTGSPVIQLYDASTTTGTNAAMHASARRIYSPINGLTERDYFLSVETSSGVAWDIQNVAGGAAPCMTMIYRER